MEGNLEDNTDHSYINPFWLCTDFQQHFDLGNLFGCFYLLGKAMNNNRKKFYLAAFYFIVYLCYFPF